MCGKLFLLILVAFQSFFLSIGSQIYPASATLPEIHFMFDEKQGETCNNLGMKNKLQLMKGARLSADGKFQGCIEFDGKQAYGFVDIIKEIPQAVLFQKTISIWFNVTDKSVSTRKQLIYKESGADAGMCIYIYNSKLYFGGYYKEEWPGTFLSTEAFANNKWHHAVIVLNGNGKKAVPGAFICYLDGEKIGSGDGSRSKANVPVSIGWYGAPIHTHDGKEAIEGFAGKIDELRIYYRALGPDEIKTVFSLKEISAVQTKNILHSAIAPADGIEAQPATGYNPASAAALSRTLAMEKFNTEYIISPVSSTRERVILNGLWDFLPLKGEVSYLDTEIRSIPENPFTEKIPVPSSFGWNDAPDFNFPPQWGCYLKKNEGNDELPELHQAWYKNNFPVPQSWKGSRVIIHFESIAHYSQIFINKKNIGQNLGCSKPLDLDITKFITYGTENTLHVYAADASMIFKPNLSGKINNSLKTGNYQFVAAPIYKRSISGIVHDVFLWKKPVTFIDNVYIITSYRKKKIGLHITLDAAKSGKYILKIAAFDKQGKTVEKLFAEKPLSLQSGKNLIQTEYEWQDPHLWMPETPNLYQLKAELYDQNNTLCDQHYERFGFREVWTGGRNIYLNGLVFRARSYGRWNGLFNSSLVNLRPEFIRTFFQEMKKLNEICPRIDSIEYPAYFYDIADEEGFPFVSAALWGRGFHKLDPASIDQVRTEIAAWAQKCRNHASVISYSLANEGGSVIAQNPSIRSLYEQCIEEIRINDPNLPVQQDGIESSAFKSGSVHDLDIEADTAQCTLDGKLDLINWHYPFEREIGRTHRMVILDDQIEKYKHPLLFGEFDCIPAKFFSHARMFGDNSLLWPDEKISLEVAKVQQELVESWRGNGIAFLTPWGAAEFGMAEDLFELFQPDTRDYSGPGIGFAWDNYNTLYPKPSRFGWYSQTINDTYKTKIICHWFLNPWAEDFPAIKYLESASVYREAFKPAIITLSHSWERNFWSGETIRKKCHIINDRFGDISAAGAVWKLKLGGREIASGVIVPNSLIKQGDIIIHEFAVPLPQLKSAEKLQLLIELRQNNKVIDTDEQILKVYIKPSAPVSLKEKIALFDAEKITGHMLKAMNIIYTEVSGVRELADSAFSVFIIGEKSLDKLLETGSGQQAVIGALDKFIAAGGKVLFMYQNTFNTCGTSYCRIHAPNHYIFQDLLDKNVLQYWKELYGDLSYYFYKQAPQGRFKILGEVCNVDNPIKNTPHGGNLLMKYAHGAGSVFLWNIMMENRYGREPEATLLMNRLFEYMSAKKNTYRNVGIFNDPETAGYLADTSGITAAGIDPENKQADLGMYQMLIAGCGAISGMSSEMKNKITGFVQNGGIFLGLVYKPDVRLDWIAEGIQAEKPKVSRILSINHDKQKITDGMKIIWASSDRPEDSKWQVTSKTPRQPINLTATLKADDSWTPLIIPHSSFREPEYTNYNQLCYQKSGKGYYVISALPLDTHAYIISRTFNTLLGNLGAADNTSSIMSEILKQSGRDPGMQISMKETGDQDWNNYFPVNLRAHVNMELQDDVPGDQKGGWDDSGPNDLRMLPTGKMTFSGIPYDIISKKEELYVGLTKQIIVMRGAQKQYFPQSVNSIPVDKKCSGLHFLHVLTWAGKIPDGTGHGKYVIRFTDGSTEEISIKQNINISDWWEVNNRVRIPEAEIAYMAKNQKSVFVGLYHFRYKLKNPEKIIKSIDIVTSGDKGIIIVAAITGEK